MVHKKLILIRHAESQYNLENRFCGHTNIALTEKGAKYAKSLTQNLQKALPVANTEIAIYSSPLKRCINTIQDYADAIATAITIEDKLIEVNFGQWEGLTREEVIKKWPKEFALWSKRNLEIVFPNGDSFLEYIAKIEKTIARIVQNTEKKYIIVCTHSTPIRIIGSRILADDMSIISSLNVRNASITVVDYSFFSDNLEKRNLTIFNSVIYNESLDI